jgi:hypothetical protein
MFDFGRWLRQAAGCTAWLALSALSPEVLAAPPEFIAAGPSAEARSLVDWVLQRRDAGDKPFAVVDKRAAHIYVFHADGRLAGHSAALLGSTPGDHTVPGVGARAQLGQVGPDERTTPAGRFEAVPGENDKGEHVVWVDYASAFAIHRLRPGFAYQARASRLATVQARGKRVSWGCVVVPVAFYQQVVERVLGQARSVVYVMPELAPVGAVFGAVDAR